MVKNGCSRHGRQRWLFRDCQRTCGEVDQRRVVPAKWEAALAHYLEGVGLRATERRGGVSHNAVLNWVLAAVEGRVGENHRVRRRPVHLHPRPRPPRKPDVGCRKDSRRIAMLLVKEEIWMELKAQGTTRCAVGFAILPSS